MGEVLNHVYFFKNFLFFDIVFNFLDNLITLSIHFYFEEAPSTTMIDYSLYPAKQCKAFSPLPVLPKI